LVAFGPYRLPSKSFQYGVDERGFNPGACPEEPCTADLRADALGRWRADIGNATADGYELVFILSAGQDESGSWQEFGVMKFLTNQDVTDEFGPPGNRSMPNYAKTRYVEWTSWASASTIWPNAGGGSSTQAESSGAATYAHELSHLLGIGDNYNNPYGVPARRTYTGPYSMMSRGSFNGPGGPHTRWRIPSLQGATVGSLHTVRDKLQLGLTDHSNVLIVQKSDLESSGTVTAEVTARAVDNPDGLIGVRVVFGSDLSPYCNVSTTPLCDGGGYNAYDLEVIDRMGSDSFTPDSGVMISKIKDSDRAQPFQWTIDANPQDIDLVDYIRPDGKEEKVSIGDYRQLADALFHVGTRSGSQYEHVDEANGVHFYVLTRRRDELGVLHYTVGARALASGSNTGASGVELGPGVTVGPGSPSASRGTACVFDLTNTGRQAAGQNATLRRYATSEVYRLEAAVDASGWRVELPNELAVAEFGAKTQVAVAVAAAESAGADATVRLTATSESDRSVSSSAECTVSK
jgi:M6 family metalloprotease-like protein